MTNVPLTYILGKDNRLMMFYFKSISILAVSLISIGATVVPKIFVTTPPAFQLTLLTPTHPTSPNR